MVRSFSCTGLILKRTNSGESDRVVHLLTQEHGRFTCIAKGVRKVTSTKRASLEPGNIVTAFCVTTKSLPLLTQARLEKNCASMPVTLEKFKQLTQILEIFERLFVEEEIEPALYERILAIHSNVITARNNGSIIKQQLQELISDLGFQNPRDSKYTNITEYVSALSDKPLRSFDYLSVK